MIEMKKTVLILGVSSFVGSNLAEFLKKFYRVIGSYCHHPVEIKGILTFKLDITSDQKVKSTISLFQPDFVIYCIGLTSHVECDRDNIRSNTLNASGLFRLIRYMEVYDSRLIYLSSVHVFSGEAKKYKSDDIAVPNTAHGKSKSMAEYFIKNYCLDYIIFRCCYFYGRGLVMSRPNWFERMQEKVFKEESVGLDTRLKVGFLDTDYLARAIHYCIERDVGKKLLNLSSQDIMSRYEFSLAYAKIFSEREDFFCQNVENFPEIKTVVEKTNEFGLLEYALDSTDTEQSLDLKMPSIEQSLCYTKDRWVTGG